MRLLRSTRLLVNPEPVARTSGLERWHRRLFAWGAGPGAGRGGARLGRPGRAIGGRARLALPPALPPPPSTGARLPARSRVDVSAPLETPRNRALVFTSGSEEGQFGTEKTLRETWTSAGDPSGSYPSNARMSDDAGAQKSPDRLRSCLVSKFVGGPCLAEFRSEDSEKPDPFTYSLLTS